MIGIRSALLLGLLILTTGSWILTTGSLMPSASATAELGWPAVDSAPTSTTAPVRTIVSLKTSTGNAHSRGFRGYDARLRHACGRLRPPIHSSAAKATPAARVAASVDDVSRSAASPYGAQSPGLSRAGRSRPSRSRRLLRPCCRGALRHPR